MSRRGDSEASAKALNTPGRETVYVPSARRVAVKGFVAAETEASNTAELRRERIVGVP